MNKERLLELADFVERSELGFDMRFSHTDPDHNFGGCLAAHAALMDSDLVDSRKMREFFPHVFYDMSKVQEYFDLNFNEYAKLFHRWGRDPTNKKEAIKVLRNFVETGEILWN